MNNIKHVFYINLETRPDRKHHVESELVKIGLDKCATRFKAIKTQNGAIGCSMSHLKLIETAKAQNLDHILIVEDDIQFLNPSLFMKQFNKFLSTHTDYDVVLIAGNNIPPYKKIDDTCVKIQKCQTTTGYLVKTHYFDTLIDNYRTSITHLINNPKQHKLYAIDQFWFRLQSVHNWYLITPLTVTQKEDYSDIEHRLINYTPAMLDLDKVAYMKAISMPKIDLNLHLQS